MKKESCEGKKAMMSKKMSKGHYGPEDKFSKKDVRKEKMAMKEKAGKEPAHSWDI